MPFAQFRINYSYFCKAAIFLFLPKLAFSSIKNFFYTNNLQMPEGNIFRLVCWKVQFFPSRAFLSVLKSAVFLLWHCFEKYTKINNSFVLPTYRRKNFIDRRSTHFVYFKYRRSRQQSFWPFSGSTRILRTTKRWAKIVCKKINFSSPHSLHPRGVYLPSFSSSFSGGMTWFIARK